MSSIRALSRRAALAMAIAAALGGAQGAMAQGKEVTIAYQQIAGPMIAASSPRQAQARSIVPAFCGMSGW